MATDNVKDYLGHPCKIAEASELFGESLQRARDLDTRDIRRRVGSALLEVQRRTDSVGSAIAAAREALCNSTDNDGVASILAMANEYQSATSNRLFELAGLVIATFERSSPAEVSHG